MRTPTTFKADAPARGGSLEIRRRARTAPRGETDLPKVDQPIDLATAREVLAIIEHDMRKGCPGLKSLALAVRVEVAIATAENETANSDQAVYSDPLFSLQISRWGIEDADFAALLPVRDPRLGFLNSMMIFRSFMDCVLLRSSPRSQSPVQAMWLHLPERVARKARCLSMALQRGSLNSAMEHGRPARSVET